MSTPRNPGKAPRTRALGLAACALALAVLALPAPAPAVTTYTILSSGTFARRVPGPDGLVGTTDDARPPALPGDDGLVGTADDVFPNPSGAAGYLRFSGLPLGGDFDVFDLGSLVVTSFGGTSLRRTATSFDLAAATAQTNGLAGTLADTKDVPHTLSVDGNGALSGALTLRSCVVGGASCVDLVASLGGGAISRAEGLDDARNVPGLTSAQAAYLNQLKSIAPASWTQIWLLVLSPTALDAANVSGPTAPFLIGGRASAVLPLVTSDPSVLPGSDADGDGVADASDNCRAVANPGQADTGGIGTGSAPDGIGDACQCGDVNGDGRITLGDSVLIARSRLVPPTATLARPAACDVGGSPSAATQNCTLTDAVIVRRALLSPPTATLAQVCALASP